MGFIIVHGSLSIFAAEVSRVAQWAWRLVVFSRQIHRGYHSQYGLLCLLWLFNKNEVHSLSGDQVMIGTTFLLNSGLLNLKYHRITSETTLVIRNVQKYVSFLKKRTLYADNRYGKMHLCLFAAKRCCYPQTECHKQRITTEHITLLGLIPTITWLLYMVVGVLYTNCPGHWLKI